MKSNLINICSALILLSVSHFTSAQYTIIFEENFNNGLTGGTTNGSSNGAWTTNGKDGSGINDPDAIWEYRGPFTTPNTTIGTQGAYPTTQSAIVSPTVSNGFMIFDSDYLDNGGVVGAFGTGDSPTPHESWLVSPVFSTVGYTSIEIKFNNYFRRFQGDAYVLLSNDGGTTWGDSVVIMDVNTGVNLASTSDNTIKSKINYIANNSNCKIAFYFDGITNGNGYYFVCIDDIFIIESPDNDLIINSHQLYSTTDSVVNQYYSIIPESVAKNDTISFIGVIENVGNLTQPNTKFKTVASSPSGVFTTFSSSVNLMPNSVDTLTTLSSYVINKGVGLYSWTFSTESDSTDFYPNDNYLDTVFTEVSDTVYARDRDATGNMFYGAGSTFEIGCQYTLYDSASVTSVSIQVGINSVIGEAFSVYIYDETDMSTPLLSKEFMLLTANQIGTIFSVAVPQTTLQAGSYVVTFKTYSDDIFFTGSPGDADPNTVYVDPSAGGTWFYSQIIPVARLNIQPFLNLCASNTTTTVDSVPNCSFPTSGRVSVNVSQGASPYTYLWSNGSTADTATNLGSGWHFVSVTDANLCVVTDSVLIPNPIPSTLNIGADTAVCHNSIYAVSAGNSYSSYIWNTGATTSFIGVSTTSPDTSTYSVTATNASGCDFIGSTQVIVLDSLSVQLSANTQLCSYDSTLIEVSPSFNAYLWNTGSTTNSLNIHAETMNPGNYTYSVLVTDGYQCHASENVVISIYPEVIVDLGPDTIFTDIIPQGTSYILDSGPGFASYLWQDASTIQTHFIDSLVAGSTYWVTVTDTIGCQGSDTVYIDIRLSDNVNQIEKGNMKIFPNPVQDHLQLQLSDLPQIGSYHITIYTLNGAEIFTEKIQYLGSELNKTINVTDFKKGNYLLKISSKNWERTVQVSIQ